jgi:hypothetical protein
MMLILLYLLGAVLAFRLLLMANDDEFPDLCYEMVLPLAAVALWPVLACLVIVGLTADLFKDRSE